MRAKRLLIDVGDDPDCHPIDGDIATGNPTKIRNRSGAHHNVEAISGMKGIPQYIRLIFAYTPFRERRAGIDGAANSVGEDLRTLQDIPTSAPHTR